MEFGFTEKTLAENDLLRKRLEYIKDQIEEYLEEPTDSLGFILKLHGICEGRTCSNCKHWAIQEEVCTNADSDYRADFTLPNNSCPEFDKRK